MPFYHRLGTIPAKRHSVFRQATEICTARNSLEIRASSDPRRCCITSSGLHRCCVLRSSEASNGKAKSIGNYVIAISAPTRSPQGPSAVVGSRSDSIQS